MTRTAVLVASLLVTATSAGSQAPSVPYTPTGWEFTGIPSLNFNADEGFGYGLVLQAYNYGPTGAKP